MNDSILQKWATNEKYSNSEKSIIQRGRRYISFVKFFMLLLLGLVLLACKQMPQSNFSQFFALDTSCSITLQDYVPNRLLLEIEREVLRIETMMSSYIDESEIGKLNREGQYILSPETFALVRQTLDYAKQSDGLFDPTIGPLSQLWDITGSRVLKDDGNDIQERRPPVEEAILAVLPLISYRDVGMDAASRLVRFAQIGMKLDLGGIAKGFAADQIAAILKAADAPAGIIDLGGNILLYGRKNSGDFWSVGVRGEGEHYLLGMFVAQSKAVVTSGIAQRYYMHEGRHYHHILSTETGYPVNNGMFSVTVITRSSTVADVLATMLFIYGVEKGLDDVAQRQANGEDIEALFITDSKQVYGSSGLEILSEKQHNDLKSGVIATRDLSKNKIWLFSLQEKLIFANM